MFNPISLSLLQEKCENYINIKTLEIISNSSLFLTEMDAYFCVRFILCDMNFQKLGLVGRDCTFDNSIDPNVQCSFFKLSYAWFRIIVIVLVCESNHHFFSWAIWFESNCVLCERYVAIKFKSRSGDRSYNNRLSDYCK